MIRRFEEYCDVILSRPDQCQQGRKLGRLGPTAVETDVLTRRRRKKPGADLQLRGLSADYADGVSDAPVQLNDKAMMTFNAHSLRACQDKLSPAPRQVG